MTLGSICFKKKNRLITSSFKNQIIDHNVQHSDLKLIEQQFGR